MKVASNELLLLNTLDQYMQDNPDVYSIEVEVVHHECVGTAILSCNDINGEWAKNYGTIWDDKHQSYNQHAVHVERMLNQLGKSYISKLTPNKTFKLVRGR